MRSWARQLAFVINYVFSVVLVGSVLWFKYDRDVHQVVGGMRWALSVLTFLDLIPRMLYKIEFEQQCLPGVVFLINTCVCCFGKQQLVSQDPLFTGLYQLEGNVSKRTFKKLRTIVESLGLQSETRAAVEARRVTEAWLWQALRRCGNGVNHEDEVEENLISQVKKVSICLAPFFFIFLIFGGITLLKGNSANVFGLAFAITLAIYFPIPAQYYKEVFDRSSVPPLVLPAFEPRCGGRVQWLASVCLFGAFCFFLSAVKYRMEEGDFGWPSEALANPPM